MNALPTAKNNHKLYDRLIKKRRRRKFYNEIRSSQSVSKVPELIRNLHTKIAISDSHGCPSEDCLGIKMIISHPRSGSGGAKKGPIKNYSNCVYRKLPFAFFSELVCRFELTGDSRHHNTWCCGKVRDWCSAFCVIWNRNLIVGVDYLCS